MDAVIRFTDWCHQLLLKKNRNSKTAVTGTTRDFLPTDFHSPKNKIFEAYAAFILPCAGYG